MMSPSDWDRLDALFHEAADLDDAERQRLLDSAREENPALAEHLARLLRSDEASGLLDGSTGELEAWDGVLAEGTEALEAVPSEAHRIGPYVLKSRLGRGGMGTVYLATREDLPRPVALKLIRRELDTERIRARFLRERRILAALDHPNIARIYDGGVAEDGRPYFVMEYVDGEPIDTYCDRHRLGVEARLKLFGVVCGAVQAAHQRLVVHRDLKPSNVLVASGEDGTPVVKLLDFGIAKLLDDDDDGLQTRTGAPVMTPAYAAPEQVRGDAVTTAADVYALGVLLYELLTGRRPYRLDSRARRAVEHAILESEPTRPSTAVLSLARPAPELTIGESGDGSSDDPPAGTAAAESDTIAAARATTPHTLRRRLRGDLDHIVLKALRKQPEARYDAPTALSADIARHLEGLPLAESRGEAWRYRARRFVRRNRRLVGTTALVIGALAAGLGAALWQADIAQGERDRARLESAKQAQMKTFVLGLFRAGSPNTRGFGTTTVEALIDSGAVRVGRDLGAQPAVQAELFASLGDVYRRQGLYGRADSLLRKALALTPPTGTPSDTTHADFLHNLGMLANDRAQRDSAALYLNEALAIRSAFADPSGVQLLPIYEDLGHLYWQSGDYARAIEHHGRVLDYYRTATPTDTAWLSSALNNVALSTWYGGDLEGARDLFEEARVLRGAYFGEDHPRYAVVLVNLANIVSNLGDNTAAESLLREALAIRRDKLGPTHPRTASVLVSLGAALMRQDRAEEGLPFVQESLDIRQESLGSAHPLTGQSQFWVADLLRVTGRPEEALPYAEASLANALEDRGEAHRRVHHRLLLLARLYRDANRPARARTTAQRLVALVETHRPDDSDLLADVRALLVEVGD